MIVSRVNKHRLTPFWRSRISGNTTGMTQMGPRRHCAKSRVWCRPKGRRKLKADIALHENPISELRDFTCHMGSHSITCHPTQVNAPHLTPAMKAGTQFTYSEGMEGWVDLVDLIAPRPEVEPATFRSRVRRRTAASPRQPNVMLQYL